MAKRHALSISKAVVTSLCAASALMLASCSTVQYASQAAGGQLSMMSKARPVERVIADPATSAELRGKLKLSQEALAFAQSNLGLTVKRQYRRYADLGRDAAVYTVMATPELSVQSKTWCYPVVGCLAYRGFFSQDDAKALAADLSATGLDVYSGGVDAYSTLGWLSDPLLNTFIDDPDVLLVELLFHELTHSTVFISGDTGFNESLGNAVQEIGVKRWLESKGRAAEFASYKQRLDNLQKFRRLVVDTTKRLQQAFAQPVSAAQKRAAKNQIYAEMLAQYEGMKPSFDRLNFDGFFYADDLNNAKLSAVGLYDKWVPAFKAIYEHGNRDMNVFWNRIRVLSKLPKDKREAYLSRWSS